MNKEKNNIVLKALAVTAFAGLLAFVSYMLNISGIIVNLLPNSTNIPTSDANSVYDYYCIRARGKNAAEDPDVVVVNIANYSREVIGKTISIFDKAGAKVIGVDVDFSEPKDSDSSSIINPLIDAKQKTVLGLGIVYKQKSELTTSNSQYDSISFHRSYFAVEGGFDEGITNVFENGRKIPTHYCFKEYASQENSYLNYPSFVWAIANKYNPSIKDKYNGDGDLYVNYVDYWYDTSYVPYDALQIVEADSDYIDDLTIASKDKIILLGVISDREDLHYIPTGDYIPGTLLHAYAISSLIHETYIRAVSPFWLWTVSLLLCFAITLLYYSIARNHKRGLSVLFKAIEILTMVLILFVCIHLFEKRIFIDFTPYFTIFAFQLCLSSLRLGKIKKKENYESAQ